MSSHPRRDTGPVGYHRPAVEIIAKGSTHVRTARGPDRLAERREGPAHAHDASPAKITLAWLIPLRYWAALGQAATIGFAVFALGIDDLPVGPLALLVAATIASNAALTFWLGRARDVSASSVGLVLGADTLLLTGLLYFSGGPSNPFSVLYLVHVTVAAMVLGMRWTASIVALSVVSFAALFAWHVPIAEMAHEHHGEAAFSIHLQGMWIAFAVAASLIGYFVARVAAALRAREADLASARALAAQSEKLASLTTLAAGAAHELGSPLATIAVAAKELERLVVDAPDDAIDDARLIRAEVDRCRAIIQRMSARAGETMGELPAPVTAANIFQLCLDRLDADASRRVVVASAAHRAFACPAEGLVQVLLNLVHNGLHATRAAAGTVRLSSSETRGAVQLVVEDDGIGIPEGLLERVGDPFFTTKAPGEGMGLGVFLARAFVERWRGRLTLESREGEGTRVVMELPTLAEACDG